MKILKKNIKFYSNLEMCQILKNESGKFTDLVKKFCKSDTYKHEIYDALKSKQLTEFEIIQLINISPSHIIDLALVIEEVEERYTEDELNDILEIFKK